MGRNQLRLFYAHNEHSQESKGRFPSSRGNDNITPRGGWSKKGYTGRKDIGSPVPPTKNTLEKRQAKE
jgi:hypothetical protein